MRLCRLMCGKAMPYRERWFNELGGYASNLSRGVASLIYLDISYGKAKPFRTSGGKAAITLQRSSGN